MADRLRARARMSAILCGTWPWDLPYGFYAPCEGEARPVRLQLACGLTHRVIRWADPCHLAHFTRERFPRTLCQEIP